MDDAFNNEKEDTIMWKKKIKALKSEIKTRKKRISVFRSAEESCLKRLIDPIFKKPANFLAGFFHADRSSLVLAQCANPSQAPNRD